MGGIQYFNLPVDNNVIHNNVILSIFVASKGLTYTDQSYSAVLLWNVEIENKNGRD